MHVWKSVPDFGSYVLWIHFLTDVDLDHLIKVVSARFLHNKASIFPFIKDLMWEILGGYRNTCFFSKFCPLFLCMH